MFDDTNVAVRYHALQMALAVTFINEVGNVERLNLPNALEAAKKFEAFLLAGE